jgi:hypothetical protein
MGVFPFQDFLGVSILGTSWGLWGLPFRAFLGGFLFRTFLGVAQHWDILGIPNDFLFGGFLGMGTMGTMGISCLGISWGYGDFLFGHFLGVRGYGDFLFGHFLGVWKFLVVWGHADMGVSFLRICTIEKKSLWDGESIIKLKTWGISNHGESPRIEGEVVT